MDPRTPGTSVQMCFRYALHISKEHGGSLGDREFQEKVTTAMEDLSLEVCSLFWEMESRSPSTHKVRG